MFLKETDSVSLGQSTPFLLILGGGPTESLIEKNIPFDIYAYIL
jgi:hypothetical protein